MEMTTKRCHQEAIIQTRVQMLKKERNEIMCVGYCNMRPEIFGGITKIAMEPGGEKKDRNNNQKKTFSEVMSIMDDDHGMRDVLNE
jgi:hypothetical protein